MGQDIVGLEIFQALCPFIMGILHNLGILSLSNVHYPLVVDIIWSPIREYHQLIWAYMASMCHIFSSSQCDVTMGINISYINLGVRPMHAPTYSYTIQVSKKDNWWDRHVNPTLLSPFKMRVKQKDGKCYAMQSLIVIITF